MVCLQVGRLKQAPQHAGTNVPGARAADLNDLELRAEGGRHCHLGPWQPLSLHMIHKEGIPRTGKTCLQVTPARVDKVEAGNAGSRSTIGQPNVVQLKPVQTQALERIDHTVLGHC